MTYEQYNLLWRFGSTADKFLFIARIVLFIAVTIAVISIAINTYKSQKRLKRIETELKIANKRLSNIDKDHDIQIID